MTILILVVSRSIIIHANEEFIFKCVAVKWLCSQLKFLWTVKFTIQQKFPSTLVIGPLL